MSEKYDPVLKNLFSSSLGPAKSTTSHQTLRYLPPTKEFFPGSHAQNFEALDSESSDQSPNDIPRKLSPSIESSARKDDVYRKRKRRRELENIDLEDAYALRLAKEETRDSKTLRDGRESKRSKISGSEIDDREYASSDGNGSEIEDDGISLEDKNQYTKTTIKHENLDTAGSTIDLDKASCTVFLANVSTLAIKSRSARKTLTHHLTSFLPSLPPEKTTHRLNSLRFRSIPFSSNSVPKKAAYAKKEVMDSTTKSTNAYAVYTTKTAAREAVIRLNGTIVLERHLRADGVAHPTKIDHRRCVFVGNLGFVDDDTAISAANTGKTRRKAKEPADVDEGLWKQFGKAGSVESVRVIRDRSTRVGKGFAYVQFQDENAVEKALLFNGKRYPPTLPRALRVTRAKSLKKTAGHLGSRPNLEKRRLVTASGGRYRSNVPAKVQSLSGRAEKLLGRAGAAYLSAQTGPARQRENQEREKIALEGNRASSKQGINLKVGQSRKSHAQSRKPQTRSSRRGAAFKAKQKGNVVGEKST